MKTIGLCIAGAALCLGAYALSMDTSVSTSSLEDSTRINNIGLLNAKSNYINLAGFLGIIGTILYAAGESYEQKIKLLEKNNYQMIQIRLLKKMIMNQGTSAEQIDDIIESGNKIFKYNLPEQI